MSKREDKEAKTEREREGLKREMRGTEMGKKPTVFKERKRARAYQ